MTIEIPSQYEPSDIEPRVFRDWLEGGAFGASPDARDERYVIMMPLPNVTGALHMGHAIDNVMQDMLIRWNRMKGANTLWMAGTDHAGIATQAVVEKRLLELEGKTRHDVGREGLVERIWQWKDQYQRRIVRQQQAMGCSCDWERQRFTMDRVCERAVRHTFFDMFRDGLIYRGNRLVNWDCQLQTAVSDDEIYHEEVQGHLWYIRYPVVDPLPGEPAHVVVATTRPETMLGDTAVACHPEPTAAIERRRSELQARATRGPAREREQAAAEADALGRRLEEVAPRLEQLAAMARAGRMIQLPLLERPIPLILDEWAKPEFGSGCVKITPGHDPNDYEVWSRHREEFGIVNILEEDGRLNANAGPYAELDRTDARVRVVADLDALGLVERIDEHSMEVGHSDRSKTPIEPYLSKQWFVRMGDVDGGIVCGRGTDKAFDAPGLAQAAMDAVEGEWRSPSGRKVTFHPDADRYGGMYLAWLGEKRDWCISRQLWWGHRIPIWRRAVGSDELRGLAAALAERIPADGVSAWLVPAEASGRFLDAGVEVDDWAAAGQEVDVLVCVRDPDGEAALVEWLEGLGLERDPDVLDTWFSSGVWPQSTLGWPDAETARVDEGQPPLGAVGGAPSCIDYYYPGSCLVTGRDIITLWVARMVLMGLYNMGDVPFTDVFIHASILDGKGERMSKSKGNGVDPVDIIERYGADAMRYVLCDMQTGTQDIRLPVQAISPFTGNPVDLAKAEHGTSIFTYICPESGKEFDVLGTMPEVPSAKLVSERFEVGRHFCNKLLNASRLVLSEPAPFVPLDLGELPQEDRWILSRLARTIDRVDSALAAYNPSAAVGHLREFFWNELCDWYLELIKPRLRDTVRAGTARQVSAACLDQVLRLLHPFIPHLTEFLWGPLGERAPRRGVTGELARRDLLTVSSWPGTEPGWVDVALEARFGFVQEAIGAIREIRSRYGVAPRSRLGVIVRASGETADRLEAAREHVVGLAGLERLEIDPRSARPTDAAIALAGDAEIYVCGVIDPEKERTRLRKQQQSLAKDIERAERKLANENFLAKADPAVVAKEREKLADFAVRLESVERTLAGLG